MRVRDACSVRALLRTVLLGLCMLGGVASLGQAQTLDFTVETADEELRDALEAASETRRQIATGTADTNAIMTAARSDFATLLGVLYEDARYGAEIAILVNGRPVQSFSPFETPATVSRVAIRIDPGPRFTFGAARIAPLAPNTMLPEEFSTSQPATSTTIREAARSGIDGWRADGHALARVANQDLVADHRAARLDARLTLNPGPQLRFSQLAVDGDSGVRPDRIREIAGLPEGETFSPDALSTATARLRDTGAFSSVTLRHAESANPDGTIDVTAMVSDAPLRRIGAGAEVESDKGVRLSAFWLHRNLFGGAESLRLEGEIEEIGGTQSGLDYAVSAQFKRPGTFAPGTDLVARFELERDDGTSALSDSLEAYLGIERQISPDLTAAVGLEYLLEERDQRPGRQSFRVLSLPAVLGFDTRDIALNPTDGALAQFELRPYLGGLDAQNGLRTSLDLRGYRAIGERVVLAGRLQFGSVSGSAIAATPSEYLFYSGGSGTVRGQPFQSLGTNASGRFTGGRSFVGVSLEARIDITDTIGLVGFFDHGRVGADSLPTTAAASHSGYGIGARYQTAIGPIRLDVGLPTSGGTGPKLYLGIGQAF